MCTVGIQLAEWTLQRWSARRVLVAGQLVGAIGIAWVAASLPHAANFWPLLPGVVVMSIGQGMTWTAMWIVAGQGVPAAQQGVASGMAATAQQIGGALGLAVLVMVANADAGAVGSPSALAGLVRAEYGAALFALLGVAIALGLRPAPVDSAATACLSTDA